MRRAAIRVGAASATVALTVLGLAAPAAAQVETFPACPDFEVGVDLGDDSNQNMRTFTDRDGNTVTLVTGRAESVVVTNADDPTVEPVTVPSRGARIETTDNGDGTVTVEWTGHLLLLLFRTDVGGGGLDAPSTTLIAGRTVFTVDLETGVGEVLSVSGRTTDLCEVLAS